MPEFDIVYTRNGETIKSRVTQEQVVQLLNDPDVVLVCMASTGRQQRRTQPAR